MGKDKYSLMSARPFAKDKASLVSSATCNIIQSSCSNCDSLWQQL
jgi:hypothetical protein